jgi:uncharacterized protein YdhG (YjbR/CyaY superfamily)
MPAPRPTPADVDAYIAGFPIEIRAILERLRQVVREAAPDAEERISYGMPTFFQRGVLIHFAAYTRHVGVYPPVTDPTLAPLLARFAGPKGNLRFPLTDPLPYDLVARIVAARLQHILSTTVTERSP